MTASKIFIEWCVNPTGPSDLCVEGYALSREWGEKRFTVTDNVRSRVGLHKLTCANGEVIELRGGVSFDIGVKAGISASSLTLFKDGFPRCWRKAIRSLENDTATQISATGDREKMHQHSLRGACLSGTGKELASKPSHVPKCMGCNSRNQQQSPKIASRDASDKIPAVPKRDYELGSKSVRQNSRTPSSQLTARTGRIMAARTMCSCARTTKGGSKTLPMKTSKRKKTGKTSRRNNAPNKDSHTLVTRDQTCKLGSIEATGLHSSLHGVEQRRKLVVVLRDEDRSVCAKALNAVGKSSVTNCYVQMKTSKRKKTGKTSRRNNTRNKDDHSIVTKDQTCKLGSVEAAGLPSSLHVVEQQRKLVVTLTDEDRSVCAKALNAVGKSSVTHCYVSRAHTKRVERRDDDTVKAPKRKMTDQSAGVTNTVQQSSKKGLFGSTLRGGKASAVSEQLINKRKRAAVVETKMQNSAGSTSEDHERVGLKTTQRKTRSTSSRQHKLNHKEDSVAGNSGHSKVMKGHRRTKQQKALWGVSDKEVVAPKMQPAAKIKQMQSTFREEEEGEGPAVTYAITAGKGTLKRKMQVRRAAKALESVATDDCFLGSNAPQKSKKPLPDTIVLPPVESDDESNLSGMRTPSLSSLVDALPLTPQSTSSSSSRDLAEADRYIFRMEMAARKGAGPPYTSTPLVRKMQHRHQDFLSALNNAEQKRRLFEDKTNYKDSDSELDYFSDADVSNEMSE